MVDDHPVTLHLDNPLFLQLLEGAGDRFTGCSQARGHYTIIICCWLSLNSHVPRGHDDNWPGCVEESTGNGGAKVGLCFHYAVHVFDFINVTADCTWAWSSCTSFRNAGRSSGSSTVSNGS